MIGFHSHGDRHIERDIVGGPPFRRERGHRLERADRHVHGWCDRGARIGRPHQWLPGDPMGVDLGEPADSGGLWDDVEDQLMAFGDHEDVSGARPASMVLTDVRYPASDERCARAGIAVRQTIARAIATTRRRGREGTVSALSAMRGKISSSAVNRRFVQVPGPR